MACTNLAPAITSRAAVGTWIPR